MREEYWKQISGDMFDFYDYYQDVASRLPNNSTLAEVGVADGKSVLCLADELRKLGKTFTLYMIDSMDYGGKEQMITIVNNAIEAGISGVKFFPYSSLEAAGKFPDVHFDFVFIDSSHLYVETKLEIRKWYPKIKEEGILAGHDYFSHDEVNRAVNEVIPERWVRGKKEEIVLRKYQTQNGYGVWEIQKKWYFELN